MLPLLLVRASPNAEVRERFFVVRTAGSLAGSATLVWRTEGGLLLPLLVLRATELADRLLLLLLEEDDIDAASEEEEELLVEEIGNRGTSISLSFLFLLWG
jgi:hypothetical protein